MTYIDWMNGFGEVESRLLVYAVFLAEGEPYYVIRPRRSGAFIVISSNNADIMRIYKAL